MGRYSRAVKNARLGDGMVTNSKTVASVTYISTDLSLLKYKERMLLKEGAGITVKKTQESGYGGEKTIHVYASESSSEFKITADAPLEDILKDLTKEDLYLWYLDDGSWHLCRRTMHLYSNSLDKDQSNLLISRIKELYGIEPALRVDRKQDGRQFYYLYFPRKLVRIIRPEVERFISENGLETMYYKVGGKNYKEIDKPNLLTDDVVKKIRELHAKGVEDVETISKRKGLKYGRVQDVVARRTYKHVE